MAILIATVLLLVVIMVMAYEAHIAKGSGVAVTHNPVKVTNAVTPEDCRMNFWRYVEGVVQRRDTAWTWQDRLGLRRSKTTWPERRSQSCSYLHWAQGFWNERALNLRSRWRESFVLHDFSFRGGNHAWLKAVREVQRVFPGTESWLLSCSAAEGGHGRWIGYGGQSYSASLRDSDTVGGNLQFRWSTFRGMYRRALLYIRVHDYRVPLHLRDPEDDRAWQSALGQALAGGWARYTNNDAWHWSASWGRGC